MYEHPYRLDAVFVQHLFERLHGVSSTSQNHIPADPGAPPVLLISVEDLTTLINVAFWASWHWFSLMGICFPFPMNRLCHLHVKNFARRQPPFDHSQSDSGNFSGRKMDAKKIVDHPIDM